MDVLLDMLHGVASLDEELMVFDWEKAARLIKESGAREASAGLRSDRDWTGGAIFRGGAPVPSKVTNTYLASAWSVPEMEIDGELVDCYRMESDTPGWGSGTYWPPEALAILGVEEEAEAVSP